MVIGSIDRSDNDDAAKARKGRIHMCIDWLLLWKLCYCSLETHIVLVDTPKKMLLYFVWLASVSVESWYNKTRNPSVKHEKPLKSTKLVSIDVWKPSDCLWSMWLEGDYYRFTLYDHPVDYEKLSIILFSKLIGERKSIPVSFVFIVVNVLLGSADLFI